MNKKELLYLRAKREYYNSDTPIMSDFEFDELEQQLIDQGSSVVTEVGAEPTGTLTKVKHSVPMKSLQKIKIDADDFDKKMASWILQGITSVEASMKLDGNAVKLIYDYKGNFMCACSRGDGEVGFDVSDKLIFMGIPQKIDGIDLWSEKNYEITGEVVIPIDIFNDKYLGEYKNPRNFVSGRLAIDLSRCDEQEYKDHRETFKDCHFVPIDAIYADEDNHQYATQPYNRFADHGFEYADNLEFRIFNTEKKPWEMQLNKFIDDVRKMENYAYLTDGIVLREMNTENRSKIGETSHHPKWAVALKFKSDTATTKLIDIEWNIGTNRKLTPVGILEPVELMGTTVQRVSLANLNTMVEKGIVPNSTVTIQKSGDIIPYVISSVPPEIMDDRYSDIPYRLITNFSDITMDELEWDEDDPYNVRYTGESDEVERRKLHKGIKVLDIDNIGKATVDLLYDSGIRTIFDLFNINKFNKKYLIESGNFKEGRALTIILMAVWDKSSFDYWRVINSLQVEGCGKTMSKELAKYFRGVNYDFSGLEKNVINKMIRPSNYDLDDLTSLIESHGFEINYPENKLNQTQGAMKTFEMTGSPKEFGWKTKKDFVDSLGGSVEHTKLTKDTDYLITDDVTSNSGKMKKAKKYGTTIIDYKDFYEYYKE